MKEISGGQIEQPSKKKKVIKREYPPVSQETAREAYLSYLESQKRSRREGRLLFAFSVLPAFLAVSGLKLSLDNSNLLERTWREFIEKVDPDTEEDKKLIEDMKRAVETGELPSSLIDAYFAIESAHGGVSDEEIASARTAFNKHALQFSELYGREKDDIGLLRAIEKSVGKYEESRTYVSDLLNDKGGNCEARAKYASALVDAVDPAMTSHLTFDTLWMEQKDGSVIPHIRLAYRDENENIWSVDRNVEPMKEEPSGEGNIETQIASAVLERHGEPSERGTESLEQKLLRQDEDGKRPKTHNPDTDSLLTFSISNRVEEYRAGVVDNSVAENKPIELTIEHISEQEWKEKVAGSEKKFDMERPPEIPEKLWERIVERNGVVNANTFLDIGRVPDTAVDRIIELAAIPSNRIYLLAPHIYDSKVISRHAFTELCFANIMKQIAEGNKTPGILIEHSATDYGMWKIDIELQNENIEARIFEVLRDLPSDLSNPPGFLFGLLLNNSDIDIVNKEAYDIVNSGKLFDELFVLEKESHGTDAVSIIKDNRWKIGINWPNKHFPAIPDELKTKVIFHTETPRALLTADEALFYFSKNERASNSEDFEKLLEEIELISKDAAEVAGAWMRMLHGLTDKELDTFIILPKITTQKMSWNNDSKTAFHNALRHTNQMLEISIAFAVMSTKEREEVNKILSSKEYEERDK